MDIARITTDLDLMVEKLNDLRSQVNLALSVARPTKANPEAVTKLRALEAQINRARAGALGARTAARAIAPRAYKTEMSGI